MTAVNPYYEETTYFLSRRIAFRKFLLTPSSKKINNIIGYCIAVAAKKFNIDIYNYVAMSNHLHMVAHDHDATLPFFLADVHRNIAKCLNAELKRFGTFWDSSKPGETMLPTTEDVLDKMLYTMLNPVKAGLVEKHQHWPGLISKPSDFSKTLVFKRPRSYFGLSQKQKNKRLLNKKGRIKDYKAQRVSKLPDTIELKLKIPPGFAHLDEEVFKELLLKEMRSRESEIKIERKGKPVLGRRNVIRMNPFSEPKSKPKKSSLNPRVAGKNKEIYIMTQVMIKNFRIDHGTARLSYKGGDRETEFPYGTFAMRIHHNVNIKGFS